MLLYFALKPKTKQPVATPRPSSPPRSAASATPKPGVSTSKAAPVHLSVSVSAAGAPVTVRTGIAPTPTDYKLPKPPSDLVAGRWIQEGRTITVGGISIRSEEHTSELQSLMRISYAVF